MCQQQELTASGIRESRLAGWVSGMAALLLGAVVTGCGGGTSSTTSTVANPPAAPAATTSVQLNMGDAPADWMLAFSMNVSSMSLTGSGGAVAVVSSPMQMEMMHLTGMMQPVAMVSVPQGTYTGASIAMGPATVTYMDPATKAVTQKTIGGPMNAMVTFSAPVTVGPTPMALNFDLDLASSVTADAAGNLSMNPVFHVSWGMQGSGNPMDFTDGGVQQMMGAVSGVSGTSFAMMPMQAAQSFTFATDSSTVFDGVSMSMMDTGMLLMVDGRLQPDGSLLATRVESMMGPGGGMGGGIVTAVSGQPATQLTVVMQNGAGNGMMASDLAAAATVTLNGSTDYRIDRDNMDMSGLPFTPVFDASHVYAGQRVMPVSSTGMMAGGMGGGGMMGGGTAGGSITASILQLEAQGLSGQAAAALVSGGGKSFTLTLPSDCAFTTLTGAKAVTVYQQAGTAMGTSPIASGSTIHVYGLLFWDAGEWRMVASRISSAQ